MAASGASAAGFGSGGGAGGTGGVGAGWTAWWAEPEAGTITVGADVDTSPDIVAVALTDRLGTCAAALAGRSWSGLLAGRGWLQSVAQAAGTGAGSASTPKVGRFTATVDALRAFSNGAHVAGADVCAASAVTTRLASRSRRSRCRSAWTSRADW